MTLTAVLTPDPEGGYVAHHPETGTTTHGDSVSEALANLKEATELFLKDDKTMMPSNKSSRNFRAQNYLHQLLHEDLCPTNQAQMK